MYSVFDDQGVSSRIRLIVGSHCHFQGNGKVNSFWKVPMVGTLGIPMMYNLPTTSRGQKSWDVLSFLTGVACEYTVHNNGGDVGQEYVTADASDLWEPGPAPSLSLEQDGILRHGVSQCS